MVRVLVGTKYQGQYYKAYVVFRSGEEGEGQFLPP